MKLTPLLGLVTAGLFVLMNASSAHAAATLFHVTNNLAEPIPEPASLSILVAGGVAMLLRRRK